MARLPLWEYRRESKFPGRGYGDIDSTADFFCEIFSGEKPEENYEGRVRKEETGNRSGKRLKEEGRIMNWEDQTD
jgi:hypothetical protein